MLLAIIRIRTPSRSWNMGVSECFWKSSAGINSESADGIDTKWFAPTERPAVRDWYMYGGF